jgi:hypothetical protein
MVDDKKLTGLGRDDHASSGIPSSDGRKVFVIEADVARTSQDRRARAILEQLGLLFDKGTELMRDRVRRRFEHIAELVGELRVVLPDIDCGIGHRF